MIKGFPPHPRIIPHNGQEPEPSPQVTLGRSQPTGDGMEPGAVTLREGRW